MRRSIIAVVVVVGALTAFGCESKGGWWSNARRTDTDYSVEKRAHENTGTSGSAQGSSQGSSQGYVDERARANDGGTSETAPSVSTPGAGTPSSSKTSGNASGNDAAPRGDTIKPGGSR